MNDSRLIDYSKEYKGAQMSDSQNLLEGLEAEIERNKNLLQEYKEIGPEGTVGASLLHGLILKAERALKENDIPTMLEVYQELRETE